MGTFMYGEGEGSCVVLVVAISSCTANDEDTKGDIIYDDQIMEPIVQRVF